MASPFSSAEVLRHRHGIHCPRIYYENGMLTMMGRQIPVMSAEQLEGKLRQIGCKEEFIADVLGGIFGIAVPKEVWTGIEIEAGD